MKRLFLEARYQLISNKIIAKLTGFNSVWEPVQGPEHLEDILLIVENILNKKGDLWITEYTITYQGQPAYTVSIMEFRNGKVVYETHYFADPFVAPAWRSQWVQRMA